MKKLVSILLAVAMILAMSITAFAADEVKTTIEIKAPGVGTQANRTYDAYKLLDLKVSHKEDGHDYTCPKTEDSSKDHVDECYNYNYTISNEDYRAILQKEVYGHTDDSFWTALGVTRPAQNKISDEQILKYLSGLIGDNGSNYSTLRKTADRIYSEIQAAGLAADETLTTGEKQVAQGYWMIVETTAGLNGFDAKSVAMLSTNAQTKIEVNPKTALPEVEKKVKDTDDSDNKNMDDHQWQDSADHDIGDAIPFKLTATLPDNMDSYTAYQLIFHDAMEAGLELIPNTLKVYLYTNKVVADADSNMDNSVNGATPVYTAASGNNEIYNLNTAPTHADSSACSFEFTISDAKKIPGAVGGNAIVITYDAKLTENAVLGSAGNANEVYLEFSNDPYSTATGKTLEDTVRVFTYGLTINKVDAHTHALKGAGFTLSKYSAAAEKYLPVTEELKGADMTTFVWEGLDDGDYLLEETTVPDGFNAMEPITFTIQATHVVNNADPQLEAINCVVMGDGVVSTGMITKEIVNHTGTILPETGAEGTFFLIAGGTLLVLVAAVFMITRKKMSIYED